MPEFCIDLDDFAESNQDWELIQALKRQIPNLKLNLFTIPGKCSWNFIEEMRKIEWIHLIPHGHIHSSSRECEHWSYGVAKFHLQSLEKEGWIHGWKSPGWQISDGTYQALLERGWWVADQAYNNARRPSDLRAYLLDSSFKLHGHIGHWGARNDNSLEYIFNSIAALQGEYVFIDEIL
jgi:hypothetical protein